MGAMSSSINAAGMVWVNDIYRLYLARDRDDRHYLRISRGASLAMAVIMCGGALLLYRSSAATLMDIWLTMFSLIGGGIAAAFLFGILTRLGDARTVLIGIGANGGVHALRHARAVRRRSAALQFLRYVDPGKHRDVRHVLRGGVVAAGAVARPDEPYDLDAKQARSGNRTGRRRDDHREVRGVNDNLCRA